MHKNSIVDGATDAYTLERASVGANSSDYRGAVRRSWGSVCRGWGVLVAAVAMLVLAGCDDAGTPADTTAPTLSGMQFAASTTGATVTATVNEAGTLFWAVYSDNTVPADAAALIADAGKAKAAPIVANSGMAGHTVPGAGSVSIAISGLTERTSYDLYAVAQDAAGNSSVLSAKVAVRTTDATAPAGVTSITAVGSGATGVRLGWTNPDPTTDDLGQIDLQWATIGNTGRIVGSQTVSNPTEGGQSMHTVSDLTVGRIYRFSLVAVDTNNNRSQTITVDGGPFIDRDNDMLIDISNLDMLNNVRYNLAGTFYAEASGTTSILRCGTNGNTGCTGYELTRNLNFTTATDYASGSINNAWRPTNAGGTVVAAATATNAGFVPIGPIFAGIFDGKGHTISNLYVHGSARGNYGLFGQLSGTVRNLGVVNGAVYGNGRVGIVAGQANSGSTIIASYTSGTADGAGGGDTVGGLVGRNNGTITASYASGTADGGAGGDDTVGGLVGSNDGIIIASYASGTANGGVGGADSVGGLVGFNNFDIISSITASYASGTANGGVGAGKLVGSLVGITQRGITITASYGFGDTENVGTAGSPGSPSLPASASAIVATTAGCSDGSAKVMATCTGGSLRWVTWGAEAGGAWDFGNAMQAPALKYADYDGAGTVYSCDQFPTGACGMLIPGQR